MASTADCVTLIETKDLSYFSRLIESGNNEWKRLNKFKYKDGTRRYFYLTNACLLATVDEVDGVLSAIVRPPMWWEMFMLNKMRKDIDPTNLYRTHEQFCITKSAAHSEPEQYGFLLSSDSEDYDDEEFVLFFPILYDEFDQHIGQYIDHLLPQNLFEDSECCYTEVYDTLKQELIDLGFEYDDSGVY